VLTYCIMTNHFHILVEIPPKDELPDFSEDEVFLRHCSMLYSSQKLGEIRWQLSHFRETGNLEGVDELKQSVLGRMHDLSKFMKTLKQRFTQWFNRKNARRGTLWEDRFKSVIVQSGHACRTMAAYIDLNPIRANMVKNPEDYRWCGYAEAVSGGKKARQGLREALVEYESTHDAMNARKRLGSYEVVLATYRKHLYIDGGEKVSRYRRGFSEKRVKQVLENGGKLSQSEMLYCRVRYFVDGGVIGSKSFVDDQFEMARERFGEKRKSGARRMRQIIPEFFVLRDLQRRRFG